jgi:hypothetical protein
VDGKETLGTVNGATTGTAVDNAFLGIAMTRSGSVGAGYNFGERPMPGGGVTRGQTATIGFWQNKNGQALIRAFDGGNSTRLGDWLAATLPHIFGDYAGGNSLAGKTNDAVAAAYRDRFALKGVKLDAQLMATALAVYATSSSLGGPWAAAYGFKVTQYGLGYSTYNVGANAAAFGVANNSSVTVMDLLVAADARSAGGVLFGGNATQRKMANSVFDGINTSGDIA